MGRLLSLTISGEKIVLLRGWQCSSRDKNLISLQLKLDKFKHAIKWHTVCMSRDWTVWPGEPFQSYAKSNVYSKNSSCSVPSKFKMKHTLWLLRKNEPWDQKAFPWVTSADVRSCFQKSGKGSVFQSATETNSSVSSRTTKPAFLWIHVSRLISSEILSLWFSDL